MRAVHWDSDADVVATLVDNALDARATTTHVNFLGGDFVDGIVVSDNGVGMKPDDATAAVSWGQQAPDSPDKSLGGLPRIGKFGMGLPLAGCAMGLTLRVFTRTSTDHDFSETVVQSPHEDVTTHSQRPLPSWLTTAVPSLVRPDVATIVVLHNLDRVRWRGLSQAIVSCVNRLGIIYGGRLFDAEVYIENQRVLPLDPLFTVEGARDVEIAGAGKFRFPPVQNLSVQDPSAADLRHGASVRLSVAGDEAWSSSDPSLDVALERRRRVRETHNGVFLTRDGRFVATKSFDCFDKGFDPRVAIHVDLSSSMDDLVGLDFRRQDLSRTEVLEALLHQYQVPEFYRDVVDRTRRGDNSFPRLRTYGGRFRIPRDAERD